MFFLIATILLNVLIFAIFKLFPRFGINSFQALVVNYCVCVVTGSMYSGQLPFMSSSVHEHWFPWALATGAAFISLFNLSAYTIKVDGITTAIVANKLSMVIPAVFAVLMWGDSLTWLKVIGIMVAFPAVYLTTRVKDEHSKPQNLLLPSLLFFGGGCLDSLMMYVQNRFLATPAVQAVYSTTCFATAGTIGLIVSVAMVASGKMKFEWKNVLAGICVGIPNYFSIYLLIRLLNSNYFHGSAAIPVLNIGIVVASAIVAIVLFREKTNTARYAGLLLSVAAILLIAIGDKR